MKWFDRKIIILFFGIVCICIPVLFAIYQSTKYSLNEIENSLLSYADDVINQGDKTAQQFEETIFKLKINNLINPCSPKQIDIMRSLDIDSTNIQAVGYVKDNQLICSSLGIKQYVGPADLITPKGTTIRLNLKLANSKVSFLMLEREHDAVVIHKSLILPTAIKNYLQAFFLYKTHS